MREKLTTGKMDVPFIKIDMCSDGEDREVAILNNNNTEHFLPETQALCGPALSDDGLGSRPIVIVDNRGKRISRAEYPRHSENGGYKPLRKGEGFPAKTPCRKNGLGLPNSYNWRPGDSLERWKPSFAPQLFLDIPLSPGCTDRLSSPSRLSPLHDRCRFNNDDVTGSTDSVNRLSPGIGHDVTSSSNSSLNELEEVKVTADRLNLPTRRPSYVAWHEMYIKRPLTSPGRPDTIPETEEDDVLTDDRRNKINESLQWIKTELMEMRSQDKNLARQLLSLRKDINKLKLQKSCQEHEDLLDDAQEELEELQELSEMCDFPLEELGFGRTFRPLKQIGVTRLNISARRFSTC